MKAGVAVVWGICGQGSGRLGCRGVHAKDSAEVDRCGAVIQTCEGVECDGSCFPASEICVRLSALGIGGIRVLYGPAAHHHQPFSRGVVGEIRHLDEGGRIGVGDQFPFVVAASHYE